MLPNLPQHSTLTHLTRCADASKHTAHAATRSQATSASASLRSKRGLKGAIHWMRRSARRGAGLVACVRRRGRSSGRKWGMVLRGIGENQSWPGVVYSKSSDTREIIDMTFSCGSFCGTDVNSRDRCHSFTSLLRLSSPTSVVQMSIVSFNAYITSV